MVVLNSKGSKPCPFCGCEKIEYDYEDSFRYRGVYQMCKGCYARSRAYDTRQDSATTVDGPGYDAAKINRERKKKNEKNWKQAHELAQKAWNRREGVSNFEF